MIAIAGLFVLLVGHVLFWAVVPILAALACQWIPFLAHWRPRTRRVLLGGLGGYLVAFVSTVASIVLLRITIPDSTSGNDFAGMLAVPAVLMGIGIGIPAITLVGIILGLFVRPPTLTPDRRP